MDITEDIVEEVARKLKGSSGLGGSDAHAVSNWLLNFGNTSRKLRETIAELTDWLANGTPPWAA